MGTDLVPFVDKLVSARNEFKVIDMIELAGDLIPKKPASTTRRDGPGTDIFRITPDQVTEGAFMRDLLSAGDDTDLVEGTDLRAQAAVDAKDFAINNGAEDEEVEDLSAGLPDRGVAVLLEALFVEPVDLSDLTRFVIAADKSDTVRPARKYQLTSLHPKV